jgi:DNA-binding transcriptional MerR regulator
MVSITISEVTARTGFPPATLRYYERIGLLPHLDRSEGGYRLFDERSLGRLGLIARAKQLGLSLEEIKKLTAIWEHDECAPVQDELVSLVTEKRDEVLAQIADLRAFVDELDLALEQLDRASPSGACNDNCGCTTTTPESTSPVLLRSGPGRRDRGETPVPVACDVTPNR